MKDVCDMLEAKGVAETVDNAALTMLARNYSMFIKAGKELEKSTLLLMSDRGNASPNPLIKIQKDAQTQAMKVMEKFGLTAKDRTRIAKLDDSDDDDSPLTAFVKGEIETR